MALPSPSVVSMSPSPSRLKEDVPSPLGPESSYGERIKVLIKSKMLSRYIFGRDWESALGLCKEIPDLLSEGKTDSDGSALHVAINDDREDVVERLVDIIRSNRKNQALITKNNKQETPLHCAAARGSVKMCQLILDAGNELGEDLLGIPNKWCENPIFVAVVHNRIFAFSYLLKAACSKEEYSYEPYHYLIGGSDGDTVLHIAIRREHLELAFVIIQKCPELSLNFNTKGVTPLEELARTPSVFRSSYNLSWWKQIIYSCIHVDPLEYDPNATTETRTGVRISKFDCPHNYFLCHHFLSFFGEIISTLRRSKNTPSNGEASRRKSQQPDQLLEKKKEEGESVNSNTSLLNESFPQNYATFYAFLSFVYLNFVIILGFGNIFTTLKRVKQKYVWSVQLLDEILEQCSTEESMKQADLESGSHEVGMISEFGQDQFGDGGDKAKIENITNKALFAAAETGVIEVVDKILRRFPEIIPEGTEGPSNRNILMVAVENQQAEIFVALRKHLKSKVARKPNLWNDLAHAVDDEDNTILHIAAKYDESLSHGWQAYGSAMQMQCEISWYEYVKSFVPSHFLFLKNTNKNGKPGETPVQIFAKGHKDLVEKGSAWLKDTSQSCSVVAALVAGVSFATSRSVPGGTDKNGKPTLEGHPAFDLFVISGLMGLGFSVTALIMFLSILTSRKQPIDFKRNLPLKLLLGLSSLFVSIATMFISFCASHIFVLEDKFKKAIIPLYGVTCLPISFYAIAQFPLYVDLMKAIVTRVPRSQKYVQL